MPKNQQPTIDSEVRSFSVAGFKAFGKRQTLQLRPLTLISGANSAGKSSLVQPLLLLKQTVEARFDPGSLLLHGSFLKFTKNEEILHYSEQQSNQMMRLSWRGDDWKCECVYKVNQKGELALSSIRYQDPGETNEYLSLRMSKDKLWKFLPKEAKEGCRKDDFSVIRNGAFFAVYRKGKFSNPSKPRYPRINAPSSVHFTQDFLYRLIHLPALRSSPLRNYPRARGQHFSFGRFEDQVAEIIMQWQTSKDPRMKKLREYIVRLGMGRGLQAKKINESFIELQINIESKGSKARFINISDVGVGVSQSLPILVALLLADQDQIVHIEQPEIHLHPRAVAVLADIIAECVTEKRRFIIETHSPVFLRRIQTAAASGSIQPSSVGLHWVARHGLESRVSFATLDRSGAFGEWPEDLDDVTLDVDLDYLNAAEIADG